MFNRDRLAILLLGAAVLAAKLPTLATPYYWDETLWIGFAHRLALLPLWQVLPGGHPPAFFGGRPPGLFLPVAALFKLTGPSIWLAHLFIAGFAMVGVIFTYRLGALLYGPWAGAIAALFLFLNPMYFAQAGMFVADLPVTACGVAAVYCALRRRYGLYLVFGIWLVLLKETGLAIVFAISSYVLLSEWRRGVAAMVRAALPWTVPLLLMAAYYTVQKLTSGSFFVQYAQEFNWLQPSLAFGQIRTITLWIFVRQWRWILTLLVLAHLVHDRAAWRRPELRLFGMIIVASGYAFSVLYLLPRYLLPVMPYLAVLAAGALVALVPRRPVRAAVSAAIVALMAAALPGSERPGTREWDLGYLAAVRTHALTAERLAGRHAGARILTAWPLSDTLRDPRLGYVSAPLQAFRARPSDARPGAPRFDVVVACSPGDASGAALIAYAARNGLNARDRIAVDSFHCDILTSASPS